jgi:hypothetical protein
MLSNAVASNRFETKCQWFHSFTKKLLTGEHRQGQGSFKNGQMRNKMHFASAMQPTIHLEFVSFTRPTSTDANARVMDLLHSSPAILIVSTTTAVGHYLNCLLSYSLKLQVGYAE